jgi:hypothetical protein
MRLYENFALNHFQLPPRYASKVFAFGTSLKGGASSAKAGWILPGYQ